MTTKEVCQKIIDIGFPVTILAKMIQKDSSTLRHWLHGDTNLAPHTEEQVRQALQEIQKFFLELQF